MVIIVCSLFMIIEFLGGLISNSIAIMSDAAHLLSDLLGFIISLKAVSLSTRRKNENFTFGYYRAEVVGAMLSIFIIWILTITLLYESMHRLFISHNDVDGRIMLITSTIGLLFNMVMIYILHVGGEGECHHGHSHGHPHSHSHSHKHVVKGNEHGHSHTHKHSTKNTNHYLSKHNNKHSHDNNEHQQCKDLIELSDMKPKSNSKFNTDHNPNLFVKNSNNHNNNIVEPSPIVKKDSGYSGYDSFNSSNKCKSNLYISL